MTTEHYAYCLETVAGIDPDSVVELCDRYVGNGGGPIGNDHTGMVGDGCFQMKWLNAIAESQLWDAETVVCLMDLLRGGYAYRASPVHGGCYEWMNPGMWSFNDIG